MAKGEPLIYTQRKLWERAAGEIRFVTCDRTSTDRPRLQQLWEIRYTDRYESEWRDVPTVTEDPS